MGNFFDDLKTEYAQNQALRLVASAVFVYLLMKYGQSMKLLQLINLTPRLKMRKLPACGRSLMCQFLLLLQL